MIPMNSPDLCSLQNFFLNPASVEVDSPLVSTHRIDEGKISLSQFGHIRIFFSSRDCQEPMVEKIYNWTQQNAQDCAYFFKPEWERDNDPYKVPVYSVHLKKWTLHKGGSNISTTQNEAVLKAVRLLDSKGLPVSFGE